MTLGFVLQLAAGTTSLVSAWKYGNRTLAGPLWGVISQICWLSLIVVSGLWGLLPTAAIFLGVHVRNLRKWSLANADQGLRQGAARQHGEAICDEG